MSSDHNYANIPSEYEPISMWGYFGYELLFSIPIIGFILLIILAITARNKNVKNFARSYFCFIIILLIFIGIVAAISAANGTLPDFIQQFNGTV